MKKISLDVIYSELKELRKEIEVVRNALIPEIEVSEEELKEMIEIEKDMRRGERIRLEDILKETK